MFKMNIAFQFIFFVKIKDLSFGMCNGSCEFITEGIMRVYACLSCISLYFCVFMLYSD